jgi:Spy/CpxP family protein refolding chaperone
MENLTPEQRADKMTAKMKKELDLTADQEKQVKASNLEFAQQQEAIRMKSEALKAERKALVDAHRAKMKGILTPEQQAKADQMMKKRQEKRSEKRRERRQSMGR